MGDVWEAAVMIPMLPCADIDRTASFWTALGLTVTYRQRRPNPYVALRRGGFDLHYYGLDGLNPDENHGTCALVVHDIAAVHKAFVAGLREAYGRVPIAGLPRITRPRPRPNNAGLGGFSLVDPDGNWIRVSQRPTSEQTPRSVDEHVEWVSAGGGALARAVENAVVLADSHGDVAQAHRVLSGAIARSTQPPRAELAPALAYLAELATRLGDPASAAEAAARLRRLADETAPGPDATAIADALEALRDA